VTHDGLGFIRLLYERALAIREKKVGPEHPNTAWSLATIGLLLLEEGDAAGARSLAERALAISEKALGPEHAWTKDSARVTADALDALGRTEEAKALRERYGLASSDDRKPS
jgi:tetratricopeptide (TPR) repeat protein